jgi:hypothetical protein
MKTFLACCFGLVSIAISSAALGQAPEWKRQIFRGDGFEVEFGAPFTVTDVPMSPETSKMVERATHYLQDSSKYALLVTAGLMKYGVQFENGIKSGLESARCKTVTDGSYHLAGVKSSEKIGSSCGSGGKLNSDMLFVTKGKWMYTVIVFYEDGTDLEMVKHFLRSFKTL